MYSHLSSLIKGKGSGSHRLLFFFLLLLLLSSFKLTATEGRDVQNVRFPTIRQNNELAFMLLTDDGFVITDYMDVEATDLYIISQRLQYQTTDNFKINVTGFESYPIDIRYTETVMIVRLNLPEIRERTLITVTNVLNRVTNNITYIENLSISVYFQTPELLQQVELTNQDLLIRDMKLIGYVVILMIFGFAVGVFMKQISPKVEIPGSLIIAITFTTGITVTLYMQGVETPQSSAIVFFSTFFMGLISGLFLYQVELDKALILKIDTKNQTIESDLFDVRRRDADTYDIYEEGYHSVMRLLGKKQELQSEGRIVNRWDSKFLLATFIKDHNKELNRWGGLKKYSFIPGDLEVTSDIIESDLFLEKARMNAEAYVDLKKRYNSLMFSLQRYVQALLAQHIYEVFSLTPSAEVIEEQNKFLEEIENYSIETSDPLRKAAIDTEEVEEASTTEVLKEKLDDETE